jgi:hypothetical protein
MRALKSTVVVAALSLSAAAGCVRHGAKAIPDAPTWVRVENQSVSDATVYVWESSSRRRLGRVGSLSSETLLIPSSMVFGATPLRFQLDFLAGSRTPLTESIQVVPGDTVILQIPPQ